MRVLSVTPCVALAALLVGCADRETQLTGPGEPSPFSANEASLIVPFAEDGVFCFDGEWSPPIGPTPDPLNWNAGWGNLAILEPEDGSSPPRDMLRLKNNPSQFHIHYGLNGPILLRYEGARFEGYGHARFTLFFNESIGGQRVEVSVVGKVQDSDGIWYHLTCKDINEDMASEQYVVTMMNLNRIR